VRLFIEKLRSKNQTAKQLKEAADAISFYFASQPRKRLESGKGRTVVPAISLIAFSVFPLNGATVGGAAPPIASTSPAPR
jgi:hypothetical protein